MSVGALHTLRWPSSSSPRMRSSARPVFSLPLTSPAGRNIQGKYDARGTPGRTSSVEHAQCPRLAGSLNRPWLSRRSRLRKLRVLGLPSHPVLAGHAPSSRVRGRGAGGGDACGSVLRSRGSRRAVERQRRRPLPGAPTGGAPDRSEAAEPLCRRRLRRPHESGHHAPARSVAGHEPC